MVDTRRDISIDSALELSAIIQDVIKAAASQDYDKIECKADDLKAWARAAKNGLYHGASE